MYLSTDMSRSKLEVNVDPATNYERVDGAYANVPDPLTSWLALRAGVDSCSFRLTWEQLNALHATLDALLTDRNVATAGHSDAPEVLADRDPTAPADCNPDADESSPYRVNGNVVTFTATDDWKLCVKTLNGSTAGLQDFPAWDTYSEALAYLETILETRPATTRS